MSDAYSAGRRIFFVQPGPVIRSELLPELIRREYEACWISADRAVETLFRYPGCIALVCADDLNSAEWRDLTAALDRNTDQTVLFGIVTSTPDPEQLRRYQALPLSCGVIRLSVTHKDEWMAAVSRVLDEREARGRRRYLRVACDHAASVNLVTAGGQVRGQILDISSVGMACLFRPDRNWPARTAVSSMQLQLKGALCLVDGFVLGSRSADGSSERVYIVMFDPKTATLQRDKIRGYIQRMVQTGAVVDRQVIPRRDSVQEVVE